MNLELCHDLAKNFVFIQAVVGTGEALVSLVIYNQNTAAKRVNGKRALLVGPIVDANEFSPQLLSDAVSKLVGISLSRFHS